MRALYALGNCADSLNEIVEGSFDAIVRLCCPPITLTDSCGFRSLLCHSYTMGCPPVRGDNKRALASGFSYVQVDKHGITILNHPHQWRPCRSRHMLCYYQPPLILT